MASSLSASYLSLIKPSHNKRTTRPVGVAMRVRAHRFRDEGTSSSSNNIVDANLSVLRERMEEAKMKERLERCWRCDQYGWRYEYKLKKEVGFPACSAQFLDLVGLVCGTIGFTCLTGTFFLCLVSLILHLSDQPLRL